MSGTDKTGASADRAAFERMLGWYPRGWRARHGEALIGMWLDEAEAEGRTAPMPAQRRSARLHGSAERLDARIAIVLGAIAVVIALIATGVIMMGVDDAPRFTAMALSAAALTFAGWSGVAQMREAGWIGPRLALALIPAFLMSGIVGALAQIAFSLSWDVADGEREPTALTRAEPALLLGFFGIAFAIGVVLTACALRGMGTSRIASWVIAPLVAGPLLLLLAASSGQPLVAVLLAVVVSVLAARATTDMFAIAPAPAPAAAPLDTARILRERRILILVLSAVAFDIGAVGIGYGATAAAWSPLAADTTAALGQGMVISWVGALPLILALVMIVTARRGLPATSVVVAGSLCAAAVASIAIEWWTGTGSGSFTPLWITAGALVGIAVGVVIWPIARFTPVLRVVVSVAAVVFGGSVALAMLPMTAFAVAPGALAVVITVLVRTLRPARTAPPMVIPIR